MGILRIRPLKSASVYKLFHLDEKRQGSIGTAPRDQAYVGEGASEEQVG
jgi:hypothetical protein